MANRIVLEIDDRQCRLARIAADGKRVQLSKPVELTFDADDDLSTRAKKLKDALQRGGLGRGDCDVVLSRRAIELRELALPPAPDDELPELVRFTSRNEFASVNENWVIDFVPLTDAPEQSRVVLAGALPPVPGQEVRQLCEQAGLKLHRLLLRPFCTAQALIPANAPKPVLLVHDLGEEVELTLAHGRKIYLTRTVKLSEHDPAQQLAALVREIQRSHMLATKSVVGRTIGETLIATVPAKREPLSKLLANIDIGPVQLIDVCQVIAEQGGTLDATDAERFVAHYGAGLGLIQRGWPGLDFAAPRRKVEKKTDYRRVALWSGLAATLLFGAIGTAWYLLSLQGNRIALLEQEFTQLKKANDDLGVDQIVGEVELIDNWEKSNVNWLEELREVSQRLLSADEAMVGYLKAELGRTGPEIVLKGKLNERETNTLLKSNLAERPYQVEQRKNVMTTDSKDYPFEFEYALLMDRSGVDVAQRIGQRIRELAAGPATNPGPGQSPEPAATQAPQGDSSKPEPPPPAEAAPATPNAGPDKSAQ
jgi:hypothetical protein